MLPLGHAAVAFLAYVTYAIATRHSPSLSWGLALVAIGSQLPDVIDKPLAFYGVLPSGRSLAHSLLTALILVGLVTKCAHVVARTDGVPPWMRHLAAVTPAAFGIGYLSHLVADVPGRVVAGQYSELTFLLWPLLPAPQYPSDNISPAVRLYWAYQQLLDPRLAFVLAVIALVCALEVWAALRAGSRHP